MRKQLAIIVLSLLSTSAMAAELPLGLSTAVVGSVTVGETLLVGAALVAGVAAARHHLVGFFTRSERAYAYAGAALAVFFDHLGVCFKTRLFQFTPHFAHLGRLKCIGGHQWVMWVGLFDVFSAHRGFADATLWRF